MTPSADPATEPRDGVLLVCRSSRLRRCWHPVAFCGQVGTAPAARTLLDTQVVLWRTPDGRLRSALDRCPHRWAQLSKGTVTDGRLVCPYHGWQFGPDGAVVEIPQLEAGASLPPSACLQVLPTVEAYGMAWISLEPQPPAPIPTIPEFEDSRFDRIEVGVIRYHASAAAIIDNNTDSTHVAFVHSGSFGADQDPRVPVGTVQRSSFGISISYGEMPVARTPTSQRPGTRHSVTEMWLPFVQVGRMHYSGPAASRCVVSSSDHCRWDPGTCDRRHRRQHTDRTGACRSCMPHPPPCRRPGSARSRRAIAPCWSATARHGPGAHRR